MTAVRNIAALAYPGLQLLDIVGPLETFNLAAQQLIDDGETRERAYRVLIVSRDGGPVPSMSGLTIAADRGIDAPLDDVDTLLVPGALTGGSSFFEDAAYVGFVRRAHGSVRRLCSVCSGALLLASAGILEGRRATTHWMDAAQLRDCFPGVRVEADRIYVEDDGVYTSGGISAGIDLALALVERDHSRRLALKVAKRLLVFLKRPGNQLQFNAFLAAQAQPTKLAELLDWITDNLHRELDSATLAARACMSERNFRRRFEAEVGVPAGRYLARARVTKAQSLLETTSLPVAKIARQCGFPSTEALRYAFQREFDVSPKEYRARFGSSGAAVPRR
ncbi:MAG TPA: GlxA family transcriptional regulator [Woeseiaceae bacterium]|nr:GlxA family transcriptional regulator [Woeseiaceae bacterium]